MHVILALTTLLLLGVTPTAYSQYRATVEVRVWQDERDERNLYISARPAGGAWLTLGTVALPLDDGFSFSGRYRYGDIAFDAAAQDDDATTVELRVSQAVADGRSIFISARAEGESWLRLGMIPLALDDGFSSTGRYRYGNIELYVPPTDDSALADCSNGTAVANPERNTELVRDCAVLLQERDTLSGGAEELNWSAERPIEEWLGITVSGRPPRVTEISIESALRGRIPPGLARLDRLRILKFRRNELTGEIPRELGLLSGLSVIHITGSKLTGRIPAELGQITRLRELWLLENQLEGEIPVEIAALPYLWFVDFRGNQLSGEIPAEFGRAGLGILYLGGNRLSGEIPRELAAAVFLQALILSGNMLTGEIPPELGSLKDLNFLRLGGNRLTGQIPSELGNLTNLWDLSVDTNQLTGPIPQEVADLPNLNHFGFVNNRLTGCIPTALWSKLSVPVRDDGTPIGTIDLPWCDAVQVLVSAPPLNPLLVEACASGPALADFEQSQELINDCAALLESKEILAGDSEILNWSAATPLADWIGVGLDASTGRVRALGLSGQGISGRIPAVLANLTSLAWLSLSGNRMTGEIPAELGHLRNLTHLILDSNQLSGAIPAELGALTELRELWLTDNRLSGAIPATLGALENLRELRLANNRLSGEIPADLARLDGGWLDLSGNRLTGSIPHEFTEIYAVWDWYLWLGGNQFDGCMPIALKDSVFDREEAGLRYCECPATWDDGSSIESTLSFGEDDIPYMPRDSTERSGAYRVTFQLVVDLPEQGEFSLGEMYRDDNGQILVQIVEKRSDSHVVIDPFKGDEFARSVTEGPHECEVSVSALFDRIVESARVQPLDLPLAGNGFPWMYILQPVDGGRTYNIGYSDYLIADVPRGMRLTLERAETICAREGDCYRSILLRDESSGSLIEIDAVSGAELGRELIRDSRGRNVPLLLDSVAASIRRQEPPHLISSCDSPASAADCAALLEAAQVLAVDARLNWSADLALGQWDGVTVDPWSGRVIAVNLSRRALGGRIPLALSRLLDLQVLELSGNELTGPIPPEFGRLSEIRHLGLSSNQLSGEIPVELAGLSKLQTIGLSGNELTGEIPTGFGTLPRLTLLYLGGNRLEGCIPGGLERFSFGIRDFSNPKLRHCGNTR